MRGSSLKKSSIAISEDKELMNQWDWKKNSELGINPKTTSIGSQKRAFFVCEKHHCSYLQIIRARKRRQLGCEICKKEARLCQSRDKYIKNKCVLAETHPELAKEWISCLNSKYNPNNTLAGSNVIVTWKCTKCGGLYKAYVSNRALKGSGCPYCSGQKVLPGFNDLQTQNPELAKEWSPINSVLPTQVTTKSNKKVYWICPLGHDDYIASPKQRNNGQGCPVCALRSHTSFPEQAIFYYIRKAFPDAINRFKHNNIEIDVYIPSKKTGIEYNGFYYHKNKKHSDLEKKNRLNEFGINLLVVKEYHNVEEMTDADYYINERMIGNTLSKLVKTILKDLSADYCFEVDCKKDMIAIREQYINSIQENSIYNKYPKIAKEWDYDKNGSIKPEYVTYGSSQKYYWRCSTCGYSYLATPKNRTIRNTGCPVCAETGSSLIITNNNNFAARHPELLHFWDYEKNDVKPEEVFAGGTRKIYWKCNNGHSYVTTLQHKINGRGCPICAGKTVLEGFNDLETINPSLAREWHPSKNGEMTPSSVTSKSNKKVWWLCKNGHEWQATINDRARGRGCPVCARNKRTKDK